MLPTDEREGALAERPLWRCPRCGREFANRNQPHACGRFELAPHLAGRDPEVVATFWRLVELAERNGPLVVVPEKTRIALQVRLSFAAAVLRRHWLDGHVVLARRLPNPRFRRIESISPRNHVHHFRLRGPAEADEEVAAWLAEAYLVGQQRHLSGGTGGRPG
jgi:Domain of unknown function (DUF5655)